MWPYWSLIRAGGRPWLSVIVLPFAFAVGVIGYNLESLISDKYTPSIRSAEEQRFERQLTENVEMQSIKKKDFVPKTVFEKNLSPSLLKEDDRPAKYAAKS